MKTYSIKNEFADEAMQLIIPQFAVETQPTLFSEHEIILLEKENLYKGFTLKDKDIRIDFNVYAAEMERVWKLTWKWQGWMWKILQMEFLRLFRSKGMTIFI